MPRSVEYPFEDLGLDFGGVLAGSFTGMAELAEDPGYDHFYVKSIVLDAVRNERKPGSYFTTPKPWKLTLDRFTATGFEADLFKQIARLIEADSHASEKFHADREFA